MCVLACVCVRVRACVCVCVCVRACVVILAHALMHLLLEAGALRAPCYSSIFTVFGNLGYVLRVEDPTVSY